MKIIYCSPTGNTKHLAKQLAEKLSIKAYEVKHATLDEETILMYSIHGFNPIRTIKRFVKDLPTANHKVHLLSVGCAQSWVNEAASVPLKKILKKKGYSIGVDEVLAMPLTLIVSFPDEVALKTISDSEQKLELIIDMIQSGVSIEKKVPMKSKVIRSIGTLEDSAARMFGLELHANKKCTSCGICWTRCPENNIREKNGKPKFGFKCMMCLRCIYECPEEAIKPYISRFISHKEQYSINKYKKLSD